MSKSSPTYEVPAGAKGELRFDDDVVAFDLAPGPVPADTEPRVLARLIEDGIAVESKKEIAR